ncbi:MAG: phytoene desaturase family protein [Halobacteriales archaeon]
MAAQAIVVGGGVGGLAVAAYLASADVDVTVLERNDRLGGRASVLERGGYRFDMGPSWYLMPDVFERFFGHFDTHPAAWYELAHLVPHYRAFFKDGDVVDMSGDRDRLRAVFEGYETGAGAALDRYLAGAEEAYEVGMRQFVYTDRGRLRDYLDLDVARQSRGISLTGSMQDHVATYFDHPKLQQLVQYSLVFLGGSPTNTPALYKLMSHVDVNLGVFYPEGGIWSVVEAIAELARQHGATFRTGVEVECIRRRRGGLVAEAADGHAYAADVVVANADVAHVERDLLEAHNREYTDRYWRRRTLAPSAFLIYLGIEGEVSNLAHHSLVLPTNWDDHFAAIFDDPAWPADPAYYVCAPSRTDPSVAPTGDESLFVLVPIAPGLEDGPDARARYRDRVIADLESHAGVDLRGRIAVEETFAVRDFARRYNAQRGTALGLAHTLWQTGPGRPDHRSGRLPGLYRVGADTRPGIGVPMGLISAEHAATAVLDDLGRDPPWRA